MAFDRQFLDELIARNDIVDVVSNYVSLQPRGGSLWGCCPFHSEKTPSFHVLPDKQLCYCFGCKKGGGVINFIMEEENLSFPDAVRFLARRVNMPVPEEEHSDESRLRSRILSLNRDAARFYYDQLYSPKGAPVLEYMKNRKITRRNATNFGLGASADEWDGLLTAMRKKGYGDGEPRVLPSAARTAGCTTNSASASSSPSSTCAAMCWALAGASSARTIRARSI